MPKFKFRKSSRKWSGKGNKKREKVNEIILNYFSDHESCYLNSSLSLVGKPPSKSVSSGSNCEKSKKIYKNNIQSKESAQKNAYTPEVIEIQ